jgi:hypothetical protein
MVGRIRSTAYFDPANTSFDIFRDEYEFATDTESGSAFAPNGRSLPYLPSRALWRYDPANENRRKS